MAYNPNRIPKGASNQAGFGTPGTAQTRQRRNAGRGYNQNMPVGRQLARQAAGGGAAASGQTGGSPGRGYTPPPSGINYAAMAARPNLFNFQDPSVTAGMQALLNEDAGQWAGGAPHIAYNVDQATTPGAYYATGQPVEGNYAYASGPGPNAVPGGYYSQGFNPLREAATVDAYAAPVPGIAGTPYQPPAAPQPPPVLPDVFISQVPETPAGTGYAMLAGMPHDELLGMNKAMGISNISDLRQTQEQLSPFWAPEGLESRDYALTSGEGEGGLAGAISDKLGEILGEEEEDVYDPAEEMSTVESTTAGFAPTEEEQAAIDEAKQEEAGQEILTVTTDMATIADETGANSAVMTENIASIEAEEQNQMDNLTDMYMNAYQEQAGALNRQFAMMGMLGSSNHMVANNAIMVQMLDQMAKERTQLGAFYDKEIFGIQDFNLKQTEQDLQEYFDNYLKLKGLYQNDDQLAAALGTTSLNMMIAYTDKLGGDFLNMLQSLEKLSDGDKKEWASKVNMHELAFWDCVGGDISKMDSCGQTFAATVKDIYNEFMADEGIGVPTEEDVPTPNCPPGSTATWIESESKWKCIPD